MIHYWIHTAFCLTLFLGNLGVVFSQEVAPQQEVNEDDLGDVSDEFQENFFEALKQKAITNHEKAIEALEKCIAINEEPIVLYSELAKNYLALKVYDQAEKYFEKVEEQEPKDRYLLEMLYQTYFAQGNYEKALTVVEKLVTFDPLFKEQLANLYYIEERYDEALNLVGELEEELGSDSYRKQLRQKISAKISNPNSQIAKLEQKIKESPKNEQNYLNLIYLYSQDDQKEKAYAVAKNLLEQQPKSEVVHLALYKFYLDDNQIEDAVNSMKIAVSGISLDTPSKYKIIKDFITFVKANPLYEPQLLEIAKSVSETPEDGKVFTEIGDYFYKKDQKEVALNFYEKGLQYNVKDFEMLKKMLLLQLHTARYEKAKEGSELAIEIYPSQPVLYLVNGMALINLSNYEDAIESLSIGMDYIIEDAKMESDFYDQIGDAYQKMGNEIKAEEYRKKSVQLQKKP